MIYFIINYRISNTMNTQYDCDKPNGNLVSILGVAKTRNSKLLEIAHLGFSSTPGCFRVSEALVPVYYHFRADFGTTVLLQNVIFNLEICLVFRSNFWILWCLSNKNGTVELSSVSRVPVPLLDSSALRLCTRKQRLEKFIFKYWNFIGIQGFSYTEDGYREYIWLSQSYSVIMLFMFYISTLLHHEVPN